MVTSRIQNFLAELSEFYMTEQTMFFFFLQMAVIILIITDMAYRDLSTMEKIFLLVIVVVLPIPGPFIYALFIIFREEPVKKVKCPLCNRDIEVTDKCPECGYVFVEKKSVNDKEHVCGCGKTFETWIGLKKHSKSCEKSDKSVEEKNNVCELCGSSFDTSRGLNIHKSKKH